MKKLVTCILILAIMSLMTATAFADTGNAAVITKADTGAYNDLMADWYKTSAVKYGFPEIFAAEGHFYPNRAITRMEFARMLHRSLDISINYFAATDIAEYYNDVKSSDAGANELYDLVTAGIIDDKGSFGPGRELSREAMVHYIINALKYVTDGQYALIRMMPAPFDDDASIRDEYRSNINEAVLLKLINGRGGNMLYPKESATRAEAVVITDRLVELKHRLVPEVKITPSAVKAEDTLQMQLTIKNTGDKDVTINHNSGQKFDFVVLDNNDEIIYTWSADKSFLMALTTTVIKPGGEAEFTAKIDGEVYKGIKDKAAFIKAYIVGSSDDFYYSSEGYIAAVK